MTDFIIVGRGLAANVLAHTFYQQKISFTIIGLTDLSKSSIVAAGIFNPVVFKRMTKSWMASKTIPFLHLFYGECENRMKVKLIRSREMIKPFSQEQEKKLWMKKAEDELDEFLEHKVYVIDEQLLCLNAEKEYGKVKQAGNLEMQTFLEESSRFFAQNIVNEKFDYAALKISNDFLTYKNLEAKNVIFCEGYLVKNNPWFNWLPMNPVKGDTFVIRSKNLALKNSIFNRDGFIMDVGDQKFKVGATYNWKELNDEINEAGKNELEKKLKSMLKCDYEIISHEAGVRPSTIDRRPIIGPHPRYKNLFVFNGLGTKGVMLAPLFANNFVHFTQQKEKLHPEVSIERHYSLHRA